MVLLLMQPDAHVSYFGYGTLSRYAVAAAEIEVTGCVDALAFCGSAATAEGEKGTADPEKADA